MGIRISKKKIKEDIPYILLASLVLITIIQASLLIYVNESLAEFIYKVGLVVRLLMFVSWIVSNSLKKKEIFNIALLFIVAIISYLAIGSFTVFDLFFFAVAYKEKYDYKRVVNVLLYITLIGVGVVFLLYYIGYFPEFSIYRYGTSQLRLSYGFSHPNVCGRLIMNLCILYVLKKREDINFFDIILIALSGYWVYIYPNSVTSALIIILLDVCLVIAKLYKFLFRKEAVSGLLLRLIGIVAVPLMFITVFVLVINSGSHSFIEDISATFYSRFWGGLDAIRKYPINLFGNRISFVTAAQQYFGNTNDSYFAVDCLYVLLPLRYGIIVTLYFAYEMYMATRTSIKNKDTYLFLAIMLLLIYSLAENGLTVAYSSFIFVVAGAIRLGGKDNG